MILAYAHVINSIHKYRGMYIVYCRYGYTYLDIRMSCITILVRECIRSICKVTI